MWKLLTQDQRSIVSCQWWMMIFMLCLENHLLPFTNISVRGRILPLSIIFPVQVWQWRILTIKLEALCVKSNIINFYIFVIQIILTKETWSLCYLVIFFGFHLHYLHSNVIWFPMVLITRKVFLHLKKLFFFKAWDVINCSAVFFLSPWDFTWMILRLHRKFFNLDYLFSML